MKTEATRLTGHVPLQVIETAKVPKEQASLRMIYKNDLNGLQSSPQEDKVFQAGPDWDPSWFANYE